MAEFALWFPPREAGRPLAALGLRVGLHVVLAGRGRALGGQHKARPFVVGRSSSIRVTIE
jgi:hypothetical protein